MRRRHWTKTPRGKEHMKKMALARQAKLRQADQPQQTETPDGTLAPHITYLYGRTERDIEYYALRNNIPFTTLARGLAAVLQSKASG